MYFIHHAHTKCPGKRPRRRAGSHCCVAHRMLHQSLSLAYNVRYIYYAGPLYVAAARTYHVTWGLWMQWTTEAHFLNAEISVGRTLPHTRVSLKKLCRVLLRYRYLVPPRHKALCLLFFNVYSSSKYIIIYC